MKFFYIIIFAFIIFIASCNKKNKNPQEDPPVAQEVVIPDTGLKCQDLPPAPLPFGWQDSLSDENKNINAFLFDPVNPDKIIYVVNGDAFGYNKLFFYNIPAKQAKYICTLGNYLPQVNHKGWITFSDVENNVYLIKSNSDNLIPLTNTKRSHDPKWDHTGNFIFYYNEAFNSITSQLVKVDTTGAMKDILQMELPYSAPFKKSDRMIFLDPKNSTCTLFMKDPDNSANDKELISGPLYSKPGQINFDNLTLDNKDENFYWSNSNGIFMCNIASLKIDTLLKNCPNFIYNNPIIAFKENELTYSQQVIRPISSLRLLRQFKAIEMNLLTKNTNEIKIYP